MLGSVACVHTSDIIMQLKCSAASCKRLNRKDPCSHVQRVCDQFKIAFVAVVSNSAVSTEDPAERVNVAYTHTQRPVPYPISSEFLTPELKAKFAARLDLPDKAPDGIKPCIADKRCLCGLAYDAKAIKVRSYPTVLYRTGPAPNKVALCEVSCTNNNARCRLVGDGSSHMLHVCSDALVISDDLFYDTLNSVS
jgi:hypothetical protein